MQGHCLSRHLPDILRPLAVYCQRPHSICREHVWAEPCIGRSPSAFPWRPYLLSSGLFWCFPTKPGSLSSASMASFHLQAPPAARFAQVACLAQAVSSVCLYFSHTVPYASFVVQVPVRAGFARVSHGVCTCRLSASSMRVAALRQHHVYAAEVCHSLPGALAFGVSEGASSAEVCNTHVLQCCRAYCRLQRFATASVRLQSAALCREEPAR